MATRPHRRMSKLSGTCTARAQKLAPTPSACAATNHSDSAAVPRSLSMLHVESNTANDSALPVTHTSLSDPRVLTARPRLRDKSPQMDRRTPLPSSFLPPRRWNQMEQTGWIYFTPPSHVHPCQKELGRWLDDLSARLILIEPIRFLYFLLSRLGTVQPILFAARVHRLIKLLPKPVRRREKITFALHFSIHAAAAIVYKLAATSCFCHTLNPL